MEVTRVGIASIPQRENNLRMTIESIFSQADSVVVALNNYDHIPSFLEHEKIIATIEDNSLGDGAKFMGAEDYDGYFFALDDDLVAPPNHIKYLKKKINQYKGLVSLLGKVYGSRPIASFRKGYTEVFRALGTVHTDVFVDIVGSGACGFHTRDFRPDISKWGRKNTADIWVSRDAFYQNVPLVAVAHDNNYFKYTLTRDGWRIWAHDHDDEYQTRILNSFLK